MIYTGPIDEFFDYRFGKLPYRCLEFKHETHDRAVFQPAAVVNYPNDYAYTRITEFKYLTGQEHPKTSIVYEFPQAEGDPYYPIPRAENSALYKQYQALAEATRQRVFRGAAGVLQVLQHGPGGRGRADDVWQDQRRASRRRCQSGTRQQRGGSVALGGDGSERRKRGQAGASGCGGLRGILRCQGAAESC